MYDAKGQETRDKVALLDVVIRNRGHTPAHGVTYWVKFDTAEFPLPNLDYTPPKEYVAKFVLYPGGRRTRPRRKVLTGAELGEVALGANKRLYLWGVITYRDAFRRKRETRFRLMYGGLESVGRSTMWWCDDGNESS